MLEVSKVCKDRICRDCGGLMFKMEVKRKNSVVVGKLYVCSFCGKVEIVWLSKMKMYKRKRKLVVW